MKIFTLAEDDNGRLDVRSDMPLDKVKQRIDALIIQAVIEQGKLIERQKIRQGFKKKRGTANGKGKQDKP